jgi:hypothetical protein
MRFILLLAAMLLAGAFTPAGAGPLKTLFGCDESPHGDCTVWYSRGGQVEIFQDAAQEVIASDIHVTFAGSCDSACTLFADLLRKHSCITKSAEFGFHKFAHWPGGAVAATGETAEGVRPLSYFTPVYSSELQELLKPYGDLPIGEPLLYIHADAAARVWEFCQ